MTTTSSEASTSSEVTSITEDIMTTTTEQTNIALITGLPVTAVILLLICIIVIVCVYRRKHRKQKRSKQLPVPSEIDRPHPDQWNDANEGSHKVHATEDIPFKTDRSRETPTGQVNEDCAPSPHVPQRSLPNPVRTAPNMSMQPKTIAGEHPAEVYMDMSKCSSVTENVEWTPGPHKATVHSYINTGKAKDEHNPELGNVPEEDYENRDAWVEQISRSTPSLPSNRSTKPAVNLKKIVPLEEAPNRSDSHSYYNERTANKPAPRYINLPSSPKL